MKPAMNRQSGILLHPTSLPGPEGIGTLGQGARDFLDFACLSGARVWQVCPLGPTGYGDSPYQCFSAIAGNPLLVDLETLAKEGLLSPGDLEPFRNLPADKVDFGRLIPLKWQALGLAARRFREQVQSGTKAGSMLQARFQAFQRRHRDWLPDYCLFMALKDHFGGRPWTGWPQGLRDRDPDTLARYQRDLALETGVQAFVQWQFHDQWTRLKAHAAQRGISVMGDLPIFAAGDSVDVWTRRQLFQLDPDGQARFVAGVPPDYFSATGQLWGNPVYDWPAMEADGFTWWIQILGHKLELFDLVRIDHFRGFAAYWAVPGGHPTAEHGSWVKAPGTRLFAALQAALGKLPVVAEDLGVITPDVEELKNQFGFPGMKVMQFAFDSAEENDHLPHNYVPHSVVYTGTHDNDTIRGWFNQASEADRTLASRYLGFNANSTGPELAWAFIRAVMASVPRLAMVPLQDILGLDSSARMNTPGSLGGNWTWRYGKTDLKPGLARQFRNLAELYGRI